MIYYIALSGGIIWHLAYYGFTVGVLPDLDIANLIGYLISIFVIGFFIMLIFIFSFIFPGVFVMLASKGESDNAAFLKEWVKRETFWKAKIRLGVMIFLIPAITSFLCIVALLMYKYVTSKLSYAAIYLSFIIPLIALCVFVICKFPEKRKHCAAISYVVLSGVLFLIPTIFLIIVVEKIEKWDGLFTFCAGLLLAASMNGLIATEGFSFIKEIKNSVIRSFVGFFSVIFIMLLFFSNALIDKPNPFIIAPFKAFRIGQVDANITLDEEYVKKSQLREKDYLPETCQNTFRFKILSSIGSEYIVQYPSSDRINDVKYQIYLSESKIPRHNLLRIPKSKVLLVEYMDSKKQ